MIYFFRHGETFWNSEHRYQGSLNSDLTPKGIEQIEDVCLAFSVTEVYSSPIDVFVSPLGRAQETAKILSRYVNVNLIEDNRLREVSLGSWDGKTKDEIEKLHPSLLKNAKPYNWHFFSPSGESLQSAKERIRSWLTDVEGKTVCAVAHGMIGRVLIGIYLNLSDDEMLKMSIAQDSYYKLTDGKVYTIGKGVLHADEA